MFNIIKTLIQRPYARKLITLLFSILLAIPYGFIASSLTEAPFLSLFLISVVSFYLLIDNLKYLGDKKYRAIYIVVNVIKLILLIYNAKTKGVFLTGTDWTNFDMYARTALENSTSIVDIYNQSMDLFVFAVAIVYKIFGPFVNQIFFYIYPLSLVLFKYTFKIVEMLTHSKKAASWASLAVITWPVNFVFSISVLREIPIQVVTLVSFYNFLRYLNYKKTKNLLGAILLSTFAALMHSGMIGVPAVYLYIWLQDKISKKYRILKLGALIVVSILVLFVSLTPLWEGMTKQFSGVESVNDLTRSLQVRSDALVANTNYISDVPQTLPELMMSAPYRLAMFTFAPLPWQVFNGATLLAFLVDGILQIILIYMIFKILKGAKLLHYKDKNIVIILVMCIVVTYALFSFGTNNYGTAMRHRSKVLPLSIILVAAYYPTVKRKAVDIRDSRRLVSRAI